MEIVETLIQTINNNLEHILIAFGQVLTTLVSIAAIREKSRSATKKIKSATAHKFIDMKFSVYQEFIIAIANYDGNPCDDNLSALISANNKVVLLSPNVYTEIFDHFCRILAEISLARQSDPDTLSELETEFKTTLKTVRCILQSEMQEFDPGKHKLAKRFIRRQKMKKLLDKTSYKRKENQQAKTNT